MPRCGGLSGPCQSLAAVMEIAQGRRSGESIWYNKSALQMGEASICEEIPAAFEG